MIEYLRERVYMRLNGNVCIGLSLFLFIIFIPIADVKANSPSSMNNGPKSYHNLEKERQRKGFGLNLYWDDGLHWDGRYEKLKIRVGGSVMVDGGTIDADGGLKRAFPDLEGSEADFRRLRLNITGTLFDAFEARLDIDFANVREIKDNWFRFLNIPILEHIKFGHLKEPFSLEELTSAMNTTFMERALPVQAIAPGRNLGFLYQNEFLEERMTFSLGGFWATGSFGNLGEASDQFSENTGFNLTTRLTGLPQYSEKGKRLLHLGFSYSHLLKNEDNIDSNARFRARPESRMTDLRLVDTGNLSLDDGDRFGVELATIFGPISLQGEYVQALMKGSGDPDFWGFYIYGSTFITGESRGYSTKTGRFTGIKPSKSVHPMKGEWGAWELALRYSYLDLNDEGIKGGKERNITIGLNWYLFPKIRMMFNYIRADVDDRDSPPINDGHSDIFQARLQFGF